jgi:hypothetical protein
MNKIILLSAIAISVATVSCKKERTCECTNNVTTVTNFNNGSTITDSDIYTTKITAEKQSKKYFRTHQACYSYSNMETEVETGYTRNRTTTTDCTLK